MATYILKNLPSRQDIEKLSARYPSLDVGATEAFMALLGVSDAILAAMDAHLSKHRFSQARMRVLIQLLREEDGSMCPCDLAERMGVTRATVTGLIDGLEREGYVRREERPGDRRSLRVRLLPKGLRFLDALMPDRYSRIAGLMAKLSGAERTALVRLLAKVSAGLPAFGAEARP